MPRNTVPKYVRRNMKRDMAVTQTQDNTAMIREAERNASFQMDGNLYLLYTFN